MILRQFSTSALPVMQSAKVNLDSIKMVLSLPSNCLFLQKVSLTKFCLRFLFLTSPFTSFITLASLCFQTTRKVLHYKKVTTLHKTTQVSSSRLLNSGLRNIFKFIVRKFTNIDLGLQLNRFLTDTSLH